MECYRVRGAPEHDFKAGGNVLSYVCTPAGEVIHAIQGGLSTRFFHRQLEWARDVHRKMTDPATGDPVAVARAAHRQALEESWRSTTHQLLSLQALRPLVQVEKEFFETILQETYQPEKEIVIREIDLDDYEELVAAVRGRG